MEVQCVMYSIRKRPGNPQRGALQNYELTRLRHRTVMALRLHFSVSPPVLHELNLSA